MSRTEQVKKVKNAEPDKKILFHRSFLNIYYISDPVLIRLNTLSGQTLPECPLTTWIHSAFKAKAPVFIVYILEFHTRRNRREIIHLVYEQPHAVRLLTILCQFLFNRLTRRETLVSQ